LLTLYPRNANELARIQFFNLPRPLAANPADPGCADFPRAARGYKRRYEIFKVAHYRCARKLPLLSFEVLGKITDIEK
jgi:hypothetical protein